jgi:hypothetical protein
VSPYSASQDGDYTLTGKVAHERVICTTTGSQTITLNPKPKDLEQFTIKRTDGAVTIDGNGKTMDGQTSVSLGLYDAANGVYTEDRLGDWLEHMALQSEMQTLLLLKMMDMNENTTLEGLRDGD